MKRLVALLLALALSGSAYADQLALPYGWTGGNGSTGQCLVSNGTVLLPSFQACSSGGSGTVTSVGITAPGIFTITGSPVTTSGTLAIIAAGTSGGIPYFSSATTLASTAALTANQILLGGGAGGTPTTVSSLGTTTTVLHGNASGAPTFGAVTLTTDVTGTLPVLNGGTGATTSTGSGNVVLSTSPTLVTPALGTPSALVLTNATGLVDGALSANVPLLNASNSFTGTTQQISSAEPRFKFNQSGAGTDLKLWDFDLASTVLCLRTRTDADAAGVNVLCATRGTTTAITDVSIGNGTNNNTYTFGSTGQATFSGTVSTSRLIVTGSSAPGNGLYLPAGNTVAIASNSLERAHFTSGGITLDSGGVISAGTKFTAAGTGCTVGATTGGATGGTFTLAAGPCTAVALTMGGATGATAPNGWTCDAHDRTAPTVLIGGESSSTTTTATVTIPAGAGTADVISFSCTGF